MKVFIKICLLVYISISITSCVDETAIVKQEPSFFDLKSYFESQREILSGKKNFYKATVINDARTEKKLDTLDFAAELKVFEESDINKIAWIDKYRVDSIFNDKGELVNLLYQANNEKLRTRSLKISFEKNQIDTIDIYNNASGSVAKLEQRLRFIPSFGYTIKSTQKTTLSDEQVVVVEVQFLE